MSTPRIRAGRSNQSGRCAPERQQGLVGLPGWPWVAALSSTQRPAPSTQQQQQPVSNQCSLLTTGTGTGDWWQHSHTHTQCDGHWTTPRPSQPPGCSLLAAMSRPSDSLPSSSPPPQQATTRRNSNPSILASRVISLSQKIIATTALPLAHLSLLPAKPHLEGRQRETLRNLLRTLVSHLSLGEADRWSCRRRVDIISPGPVAG